jgi:hypothetical protein
VFYIGGGKVVSIYTRKVYTIEDYRETMLRDYNSVLDVIADQNLRNQRPSAENFPIKEANAPLRNPWLPARR